MRRSTDSEFEAFVATHGEGLMRYGYLLTGNAADAEDLVQNTLVKVYLAWSRISDEGSPVAYTRKAMARTNVSQWRSRTRRVRVEDEAVLDRSASDSDDFVSSAAERDEVWRLLATLGPRQRSCVVLRYYEDLPIAEIADVLGCGIGTVKSQLSRAMAALRGHLDVVPLVQVEEN